MQTDRPPITILLVEDNPGDALLAREAMRFVDDRNQMHIVPDGEKALTFLSQREEFSAVPKPDLIILDLNLPRKRGQDVLLEVKAEQDWRRIPVVILTSSEHEDDVKECYDRHANCYIKKPMNIDGLVGVMSEVYEFWFSTVQLPPN